MATYSADSYVWSTWNCTTTSSTDCSSTVWYSWNDSNSSTSSTTTDTWEQWNTSTHVVYVTDESWNNWNAEDERKRAERRERRRQEPRQFEGGLTDSEKRELREQKAKKLLLDLIGNEQLKVYEETGRVFVKGRKYDYIVKKQGGVDRIEKDKITDLCVHLKDQHKFPDTDNVIALKLAIENDEKKVLKLANEHGSRNRPEQLPRAACM